MRSDLRVVLDANVIVSALLLPRSVPRHALDLALRSGIVLASHETLAELDAVLRRPKLNAYLPESERLEFVAAFARSAELVRITHAVRECRDRKDNHVLEVAVSGSATHIVTGDDDLLAMHPFRDVAVLSPRDFIGLFDERAVE